jgi:hypothetical protein
MNVNNDMSSARAVAAVGALALAIWAYNSYLQGEYALMYMHAITNLFVDLKTMVEEKCAIAGKQLTDAGNTITAKLSAVAYPFAAVGSADEASVSSSGSGETPAPLEKPRGLGEKTAADVTSLQASMQSRFSQLEEGDADNARLTGSVVTMDRYMCGRDEQTKKGTPPELWFSNPRPY